MTTQRSHAEVDRMDQGMSEITAAVRAELSMLTPDQVCELLQVKKRWLYVQVQLGLIPHVRIGQQLRFRASELDAYLRGEWAAPKVQAPVPAAPRRGRPRKY